MHAWDHPKDPDTERPPSDEPDWPRRPEPDPEAQKAPGAGEEDSDVPDSPPMQAGADENELDAPGIAREAVGVDWVEGRSLVEEVFSLRDEVEQGFAFGAGAVWLGEFDFGGAGGGFDGFVGGFGGGAAFTAVAWLFCFCVGCHDGGCL